MPMQSRWKRIDRRAYLQRRIALESEQVIIINRLKSKKIQELRHLIPLIGQNTVAKAHPTEQRSGSFLLVSGH